MRASDRAMRRSWILAAILLLGAAAVATGLTMQSMRDDRQRGEAERLWAQTQTGRMEIENLLSALQDAETGQRGYLLVAQPAYLAPYEAGRRAAVTHLATLATVTSDNPVEQRHFARLRTLTLAKLDELATTIYRVKTGDRAGAIALVAGGRGKTLMDAVRAEVGSLRAIEDQRLTVRARALARAVARDKLSTEGLQVFGLFLVLGAAGLTVTLLRNSRRLRFNALIAASEARLRHALEAGRMVAWDQDLLTGRVERSENAAGLFGLGAGVGEDFLTLIHPDDGARVRALHDAAIRGEADYDTEFRVLASEGRELWVEDRARLERDASGRAVRLIGIASDVTARKRAEMALRAGQERFRAAVTAVQGILWTNNARGEMEGEQLGWATLTGQTFDEYQGLGWSQAVHPDDAQPTMDAWSLAIAERRTFVFEHRVRRRDGQWRRFAIRAVPTFDAEGAITQWVGVHTDVTVERNAQERQGVLLRLADCLRVFSDPHEMAAAATEVLGRHLGVSRVSYLETPDGGETFVFETGYADGVAPLAGSMPAVVFGLDDIADLREGVTTHHADVTADPRTAEVDYGGRETRAALTVPLMREGVLCALLHCTHRDVRPWTPDEVSLVEDAAARTWELLERARAQLELRRLNQTLEQRVQAASAERAEALARLHEAQKIETLGQLTGGVAHDFNNLLTPIMGGLDILSRKLAHDERAQRIASGAMQSAERAKTLVQRLLSFGRRQTLQSRAVNLAALLEGMRDLIERSIGPSVRITIEMAHDLPAVEVDPNQLELAILNLCVNARDAMEGGGRLTIAGARIETPDDPAQPAAVALRVSDTGKGMDATTLARATEPFFTTKGVGQGTGLGLSMVYGLAAQSGGHLTLTSVAGRGTTAELVLPVATGPADERPSSESPARDRGVGTILLVDDEELVRMSIAEGLRDLGYKVVEAASASSALERLREGLAPDVLITDHVMPGMTGAALAREARAHSPRLAVLMITGYANLRADETRDLEVLAKPFHPSELAARITALIKRPDAVNVVRLPVHRPPLAAEARPSNSGAP